MNFTISAHSGQTTPSALPKPLALFNNHKPRKPSPTRPIEGCPPVRNCNPRNAQQTENGSASNSGVPARVDALTFEQLQHIWGERAEALAEWTMGRMVNRTDHWGQYRALIDRGANGKNTATTMPFAQDRAVAVLDTQKLITHFHGVQTSDLLGLHLISPENTCLWFAFDIDNHGDEPNPTLVAANKLTAISLYERLVALGLNPLLTNSNGNGGFHCHVFLASSIASEQAFAFGQRIALCVDTKLEAFPKQKNLKEGKLGNWLRLFGRHHTRKHYTEVYGDGCWYSGNEAIDRILAASGDDPAIIVDFMSKPVPVAPAALESVVTQSKLGGWLRQIVARVPSARLDDYDDWLRVGMAIHHELAGPEGLAIWDQESKRSGNYQAGACDTKWETFDNASGDPVSVGTLVFWICKDEPEYSPPLKPPASEKTRNSHTIQSLSWAERRLANPTRKYQPPVIDGLLRLSEVMNVVSGPKIGKSWIVMDLALSVARGGGWFGFDTTKGKVLLIDEELHGNTIDARLDAVAAARQVSIPEVESEIDIVPLRGTRTDIAGIEQYLLTIPQNKYSLIILDPLYLLFPDRASEANDHDVRDMYQRIIRIASASGAAVAIVHHTTKGNQVGKGITDVGSGHGVLSRAPDTHVTLIAEPSMDKSSARAKFEAVTRTFPKPHPRLLERNGHGAPVWTVVDSPTNTDGKPSEGRDVSDAMRFATICARPEEEKRTLIEGRASQFNVDGKPLPLRRAHYLFEQAISAGFILPGSKKKLFYRSPTPEEEIRRASQQQLIDPCSPPKETPKVTTST